MPSTIEQTEIKAEVEATGTIGVEMMKIEQNCHLQSQSSSWCIESTESSTDTLGRCGSFAGNKHHSKQQFDPPSPLQSQQQKQHRHQNRSRERHQYQLSSLHRSAAATAAATAAAESRAYRGFINDERGGKVAFIVARQKWRENM